MKLQLMKMVMEWAPPNEQASHPASGRHPGGKPHFVAYKHKHTPDSVVELRLIANAMNESWSANLLSKFKKVNSGSFYG